MLIDTHAHLFWDSFKSDLPDVLKRAQEAGITTIFNVGTDLDTSQQALDQLSDLSTLNPSLTFYSTIGIHPHDAFKYNTEEKLTEAIQKLEEIYHQNPEKVIGVGECGLDFFFSNNPDWVPSDYSEGTLKDLQIKLFQAQINLAKKLNLPLIVHVRDYRSKNPENIECWSKAIEMTKDYKGIYHCFSGTLNTIYQILNTKFLVSFAANITYPKNDYLKEAAKLLPLDRICLETDSPFLAPQSSRGQRNEPRSVRESAELIAQLKNISLKELAHQTTQNVQTLFNLK